MVEFEEMTPETERDLKLFSHTVLYKQGGSVVKDGIEIKNAMQLALNLMKQVPETTEFQAVDLVFLGLGAEELNDPLIMERLKDSEQRAAILKAASNLSEHEEEKAAESDGSIFRYILKVLRAKENTKHTSGSILSLAEQGIDPANSSVWKELPEIEEIQNQDEIIKELIEQGYTHGKPCKSNANGKKKSNIMVFFSFDDSLKSLTSEHKKVHDVIGNLYDKGNVFVTPEQIHKSSGKKGSPNKSQRKKICNLVEDMKRTPVFLDNSQELAAEMTEETKGKGKGYPAVIARSTMVLHADIDCIYINGRVVEAIHILQRPALYALGIDRGQFITVPVELWNVPDLKDTRQNTDIIFYLIKRVFQIRRDYNDYEKRLSRYNKKKDKSDIEEPKEPNRKITWKSIYEACGVKGRDSSQRMNRKRIREKVILALNYYITDDVQEKSGIISYVIEKTGIKIYPYIR